MRLEVRDAVLGEVGRRTAAAVPGVARLHEPNWRPGVRARGRTRGVEVERVGSVPVVTLRLVARRGRPVLEVVRTVQRSVRQEVERLTGLTVEVSVVVVDLD